VGTLVMCSFQTACEHIEDARKSHYIPYLVQNYSKEMESLLGYPHCSLHWRCALDTQSSAEKQAASHTELFAGSRLE